MKCNYWGIVCAIVLVLMSSVSAWSADQALSETTKAAQVPSEAMEAAPSPSEATEAAQAPSETMKPVQAPSETVKAAPVPSETTKQETAASQNGFSVADAVVCQDVIDRMPIGSGDVFSQGIARVYCFCRVMGAEDESSITQNWYYKGTLKASVKLPVRSSNWRTWSSKSMIPGWTGEWMVEILSAEGAPLESIVFYIQ